MRPPSFEVREAFKSLARHGDIAAAVCAAVVEGLVSGSADVRAICTASGIALARSAEMEAFLLAAERLRLFERRASDWRPARQELHCQLAQLLAGAALYRAEVHGDADVVRVVMTLPPAPSAVAQELNSLAAGLWGMVDTKEVLPSLAEQASHRFCVMTPFIDEVGVPVVMNLFQRSRKCARRSLIIRATPEGGLPPAVHSVQAELSTQGVQIRSLRIDRPESPGYETFHAKVVLADDSEAYVGSANMTKWSFEQSLELGVLVRGRAARTLARVVDAVESVSTIV
ncbi:MAG: hypothetical protein ING77_07815 [Rhodocyclaceae bacterium]|nr:hypothetical protein [Rhodocyclaceae bacterium]MCA3109830.1 hypothetical protein [Rhodocyclaceae bacterium]MCA3113806.1 hypothetical protein [Rhodocyclaceae bacterium]MCA3118345.1 hypothetical protein [Rhodocyclaceae bacterium]MCA3124084.1 hypothetical protein [Rhodocyclaceae bacterium]